MNLLLMRQPDGPSDHFTCEAPVGKVRVDAEGVDDQKPGIRNLDRPADLTVAFIVFMVYHHAGGWLSTFHAQVQLAFFDGMKKKFLGRIDVLFPAGLEFRVFHGVRQRIVEIPDGLVIGFSAVLICSMDGFLLYDSIIS